MASGSRLLFFRRFTCNLRSVNTIYSSNSITYVRRISSSCFQLRSSKFSTKDDSSDLDFFGIEEPENGRTALTDDAISAEERRFIQSLVESGYAKQRPKRYNYDTGFGTIRFDRKMPEALSDYLPNLKHAPSMDINSGNAKKLKRKQNQTANSQLSYEGCVEKMNRTAEVDDLPQKSEISFIDEQYFSDVSLSSKEEANAQNRSSHDHSDWSVVDENVAKSSHEKVHEPNSSQKQGDLTFIDEQYFDYLGEASARNLSTSVDHSKNEQKSEYTTNYYDINEGMPFKDQQSVSCISTFEEDDVSSTENLCKDSDKGKAFVDETHDASFFYDQYFDQNSMYSYEKPTISSSDVKTKKIADQGRGGTTFIDEQYFENHLKSNLDNSKGRSSKDRLTDLSVNKRGPNRIKPNQTRDDEIVVDSNGEAQISDIRKSSFNADKNIHRKEQKQKNHTNIEKNERNASETETLGAYELAMKIRKEYQLKSKSNLRGAFDPKEYDSDGFKILRNQVPHLEQAPSVDVVTVLRESIIYNNNDIVAISKPYGLPSQGGPGIMNCVASLVDRIIPRTNLYPVHGLDKDSTGVMLLAKTEEMASRLKECFIKRNVQKRYLVITKDIPEMPSGEIDIPIVNGKVGDRDRKCLRPYYSPELKPVLKSRKGGAQAITRYRVLDTGPKCALLECMPLTGKTHQIRVHLSFGLNCPVLGDHKYAHLNKIAPMRLHPEMLKLLKIQQPKARYVPMHLHARSIVIPEFFNGKNLYISAPLPPHFLRNMQDLKMKLPRHS